MNGGKADRPLLRSTPRGGPRGLPGRRAAAGPRHLARMIGRFHQRRREGRLLFVLGDGMSDSFPPGCSDPGGGVSEATKTSRRRTHRPLPFWSSSSAAHRCRRAPSGPRHRPRLVRPSNCVFALTAAPPASLRVRLLHGHAAHRVEDIAGPISPAATMARRGRLGLSRRRRARRSRVAQSRTGVTPWVGLLRQLGHLGERATRRRPPQCPAPRPGLRGGWRRSGPARGRAPW